jgi:hypothetical protein
MSHLTRRAFLGLAILLAPATRLRARAGQARAPVAQPPAISRDEFLRLSQRLVGRTALDKQVASVYLDALRADPANIPLLARLARNTGPALTPAHLALERTIIESWYTGIYTLGGEKRLATHMGALMWSALNVPAPGTCASAFGAWSRAPRTPA